MGNANVENAESVVPVCVFGCALVMLAQTAASASPVVTQWWKAPRLAMMVTTTLPMGAATTASLATATSLCSEPPNEATSLLPRPERLASGAVGCRVLCAQQWLHACGRNGVGGCGVCSAQRRCGDQRPPRHAYVSELRQLQGAGVR